MSSHSVKLSKALREIEWTKKDQKLQRMTEYSRGLYNGLELAWALLNGVEPKYIKKDKEQNEKD